MGSKGSVPPHQRRPIPGSNMHSDSLIPSSMHHVSLGAYSFDMPPPPEVIEQKLDMQHEEIRKLVMENRRLATTHFTLRQELTLAQQDLQKMDSHMSSMRVDQDQHMRALVDKMAKMEGELHTSEPVKVEYQKACAEARGLAEGRQELIVKVQKLSQDLQKRHGSDEDISTLMSQLEALREEYQRYRAEYDYERKLLTDHYESLQAMERNYVSVVGEIEKLRAQLRNATNLEINGGSYGSSAGYKENDISGHQSVGENAYNYGFGVSQNRGPPPGNAASYSRAPPSLPAPTPASAPAPSATTETAPASARSRYEAPTNPGYESYGASRNAGYGPSWASSYDPSMDGTSGAPSGGGYEVPKGSSSTYAGAPRGTGGAQAASMTPGGNIGIPYGFGPASNSYGSVQMPPPNHGYMQAPNSIAPPNHGVGQPTIPYGSAQTTPPNYGTEQPPNSYGSAHGTTQPQYGSGQDM